MKWTDWGKLHSNILLSYLYIYHTLFPVIISIINNNKNNSNEDHSSPSSSTLFGGTNNDIILCLWSHLLWVSDCGSDMTKALCSSTILNIQTMSHLLEWWLITSKTLDIVSFVYYTYLRHFILPLHSKLKERRLRGLYSLHINLCIYSIS